MATIQSDTIFTNTAETTDGGFYWEGLEKETPVGAQIIDWHGKPWTHLSKTPSAHPNSRFCTPAKNCPIMDPAWESTDGVPIDAILFGGRRPEGFPLVYETFDWEHGVMTGAAMRSESTAAAEHKGKVIMHDPFAMRPFFGYNFGQYLNHWLSMPYRYPNARLPKIYQVNWFRKSPEGKFLWPGFGENARVLDWILRRIEGEPEIATRTPIGFVPSQAGFNLSGLEGKVDWANLTSVPKDFWLREVEDVQKYLKEQVGDDLPGAISAQTNALKERLMAWDENTTAQA